ncbi:MAG: hypothetical protein AAF519_11010 [Bacteroidota bacterium]
MVNTVWELNDKPWSLADHTLISFDATTIRMRTTGCRGTALSTAVEVAKRPSVK